MRKFSNFETGIGKLPHTEDPFRGNSYVGGVTENQNQDGGENMVDENYEEKKPEDFYKVPEAQNEEEDNQEETQGNIEEIVGNNNVEYQQPTIPDEGSPSGDSEAESLYKLFEKGHTVIDAYNEENNLNKVLDESIQGIQGENKAIDSYVTEAGKAATERSDLEGKANTALENLKTHLGNIVKSIINYHRNQTSDYDKKE